MIFDYHKFSIFSHVYFLFFLSGIYLDLHTPITDILLPRMKICSGHEAVSFRDAEIRNRFPWDVK